jgi:hypothetical protein
VDRTIIEQHLVEAERDVLEGEQRIIRQRELLAELDRDGRRSTHARALLVQLEELHAVHVADRNRWRNRLNSFPKPDGSTP